MSDPLAALEAEIPHCYTFGEDVDCLGLVGGVFASGATWTLAECCLPCRLRAAIAKTREALDEEFRWVPVDQVGERWEPRSRAEAEALMRDHPAGALFPGITRIEKQTRFVTPWKTVEEA